MEAVAVRVERERTPAVRTGHVRENRSVLAEIEKRTLIWLARRMPAAVNSDHLSALGLAGLVAAGVAFGLGGTHRWALPLVVVALVVNWFGDSLDGTLARVRDQQRPNYGYYVDHVIDIFGTASLFSGLALGGFMSPVVALGLSTVYVAVMAESFLATHARGVFKMSTFGFGPTELRIVLSIGALALMHQSGVVIGGFGPFLLFDVGGLVAIVGMVVAFLASAFCNGRALYRAEPMRAHASAERASSAFTAAD